jgi:hypothetical protein
MQNGKGSKPRPINDLDSYLSNYDSINWSKKNENSACNQETHDVNLENHESNSNSTSTETER